MDIPAWVIVTIAVLVIGIIVLSGRSLFRSKTREQYLEDLASHLGSKFEPLKEFENGFIMKFHFEGFDFEFLDLEDSGFREDVTAHKAFLKTKTDSNLTLHFTEGGRSTIKSDIVKASEIKESEIEAIEIPKQLKNFNIFSNSPKKANEFFRQDKVVEVFAYLKNVDARGHANLPISLQEGVVTIQFYSSASRKPSIFDLEHSVAKIEDYLDDLKIVSKALKTVEEKFKE